MLHSGLRCGRVVFMNRDQEKRRDNFMRLARMANVVPVDHFYVTDVFLEKFAEMVAAEEREACAKVCEEQMKSYMSKQYTTDPLGGFRERFAAEQCAAAIRARGEA